ncbi:MAG TPA: NAD(P)H-dependent oxidoreductase [Gammaproteobacteria bacterium]|nr:NAD(P)H-dependent oxidoreductase [Gammaproteobacteria bacterium]
MNVLVILGHPRETSLCGAIAEAFTKGARDATGAVNVLRVGDMAFEPDVVAPSPNDQLTETDVQSARRLITWADHLVLVFPTWWGGVPARMKAFFDRVLAPGFAFRHHADSQHWDKLLEGRTAHLITTMDTPHWVYKWIYRNPGLNAVARATLGYCGVRTVRTTVFGPVEGSTEAQRKQWLQRAEKQGRELASGPLSRRQVVTDYARAWLQGALLQFYPMSLLGYAVGALAAARLRGGFDSEAFWVGCLVVFFLELATVLSNDYFDYRTDRMNLNAGPFNGGSRVLVNGVLSQGELKVGMAAAVLIGAVAGGSLLAWHLQSVLPGATILTVFGVLALGYTVPPLMLVYRTLGELDVALTHSAGVLLCGFVFQGGHLTNPVPWLLSLPLGIAVLPSIALSAIPDLQADRTAGKKTVAVRYGHRATVKLAMGCTGLAAALALIWHVAGVASDPFGWTAYLILIHALLLLKLLRDHLKTGAMHRFDRLMIASLTFVMWFAVVPLIRLS